MILFATHSSDVFFEEVSEGKRNKEWKKKGKLIENNKEILVCNSFSSHYLGVDIILLTLRYIMSFFRAIIMIKKYV